MTASPLPPTRQQLIDALEDPDAANPLAIKIAAALDRLSHEFAAQAKSAGAFPKVFSVAMPSDEIQNFALELFTKHIAAGGGAKALSLPRSQARSTTFLHVLRTDP